MHFTHNIGFILLAILLILWGLTFFIHMSIGVILAILAIAAGIFILLER